MLLSISSTSVQGRRSGFTIVELLVVVVVLSILAALVVVGYGSLSEKAKVSTLYQTLSQAKRAVLAYEVSGGAGYPASLDIAGVKSADGVDLHYSYDNADPISFCITATMGDLSYKISSIDTEPVLGACDEDSQLVYYTAGGWTSYPIPWSSGDDRGYGPHHGVYFPSALRSEASGQLTLFNPYALTSTQSSVNTYLYCRNVDTNAVSSAIAGPTFTSFNSSNLENTVSWSCPGGSVLYALSIGSVSPGPDPDSFSGSAKTRTWYSEESPNYVASSPYTPPVWDVDPEGWVSQPMTWGAYGAYSDLGHGPYYAVFFANDPEKDLTATQTGVLQLHNPYSNVRAQGGVKLTYWCKNVTTGIVRYNGDIGFGTFNATTTREVTWSCPSDSVLFAGTLASVSSTPYPNTAADKTRYWFSGESIRPYQSYLDSVRTRHDAE